MEAPATASWDLSISNADFEKLKAGFESEVMEQRWDIVAKEPDENGIISVHVSRSWTEEDQYILAVKPSVDGGGGKITSITYELNQGEVRFNEERAKRGVVIVCRMVLKCEFDSLPLYDRKLLYAED
jgi:hypothetical protein